MTALLSALAAFLAAAFIGKPIIHFLKKKGLYGFKICDREGVLTPDTKPVSEMGGLIYLVGLLIGGIIALLALLFTKDSETFSLASAAGKTIALLICTLLTGVIGLFDDWQGVRKSFGAASVIRLVLICMAGISFLIGLCLSGGRSTLVLIPFVGSQIDLGSGWTIVSLLLFLGFAYGGRQLTASEGQSVSVSFALSLGTGGVFAVFAVKGLCDAVFASAGALLAMLLFVFPPEKIREGMGIRMAGSVLPIMAGIAGGTSIFILFMGLPFIFEGIYAIIKLCAESFGKEIVPDTFGSFLMEKGVSGKAVTGLYTLLTLIGAIAAIVSAMLYF